MIPSLPKVWLLPLYVSPKLATAKSTGVQYIDLSESYPGYLKKEGSDITLDLSTILMKPNSIDKGYTSNLDEVSNHDDLGQLYATTWDGNIQFILRKYYRSNMNSTFMFNAASYGGTTSWIITDLSISSQFMLPDLVYKVQLSLDYIHEWFSIYKLKDEISKTSQSPLLKIDDLSFNGVSFSFKLGSDQKIQSIAQRYKNITLNSVIVIEFDEPQNRDFVFDLAIQFRNLFQLIFNKDVGLHKILYNENRSLRNGTLIAKDERENWFISQSYLPDKPNYKKRNFDNTYTDIQSEFGLVLKKFFSSEKIQELTSRYLITKQFKIPIISGFLTLSAGVENFFNGATFSNGDKVKNLENKLTKLFNYTWSTDPNTEEIIRMIKDNRDYYIHGDKSDKKLNELDLLPIYKKFQDATRNYLLKELSNSFPIN